MLPFFVDIEINGNIHKVDLNWDSRNVAVLRELKETLRLRPVVTCGLSLSLVLGLLPGFFSGFSSF